MENKNRHKKIQDYDIFIYSILNFFGVFGYMYLEGFDRLISTDEIDNLINDGKLEFLDRYKNKYEIWKKEKRC